MAYHVEMTDAETLVADKPTVKTNQRYVSPDGVIYTVFSHNKVTRRRRYGLHSTYVEHTRLVKAFTHDLTVNDANGTYAGRPCHWIDEMTELEFLTEYTLVAGS